jgi:hypothetical protein
MSMTDADIEKLGIIPGVIDETARRIFSHSHCDELAHALQRQTDYPVNIATQEGQRIHAGVLRPDDQVLDIYGAEGKDDWLASCRCDSFLAGRHP